jgi:hypothetical protein
LLLLLEVPKRAEVELKKLKLKLPTLAAGRMSETANGSVPHAHRKITAGGA